MPTPPSTFNARRFLGAVIRRNLADAAIMANLEGLVVTTSELLHCPRGKPSVSTGRFTSCVALPAEYGATYIGYDSSFPRSSPAAAQADLLSVIDLAKTRKILKSPRALAAMQGLLEERKKFNALTLQFLEQTAHAH